MVALNRFVLVAVAALGIPTVAGAVVVNIDFNGTRPGDAVPTSNFTGVGALGTVSNPFNDLPLNSDGSASTVTGDNQTVSDATLTDENLTLVTGLAFSAGPLGGDVNGSLAGVGDLYNDYFFNNSAGTNAVGVAGSPFSFTGITGATADIFVYGGGNGFAAIFMPVGNPAVLTLVDGTPTTLNGFVGRFFDDVPVLAGAINGSFRTADLAAETAVVGGISISYTPVPEPTTVSLLGLSGLGLLARRRR